MDPADIRLGLAAWARKGLDPSALPSVVNEVMNAAPPLPPHQAEKAARRQRWLERARAEDAAEAAARGEGR
jgi:hypothetical protein